MFKSNKKSCGQEKKVRSKRLWLSLILSLLCMVSLCCAFLTFNNGSALADVSSTANAIKWESIKNHQYYEANFTANDNMGRTLTLANMPDGPNASRGVCSFDADTATARGSNIVNAMKTYVANYSHFKATVKIPAYTEYKIKFSETMYINSKISSSGGLWHGWADFYAYGETDTSSAVQFGYVSSTSGSQAGYIVPSGVKRIHNSVAATTSGSKKTYAAAEAYTATFTNNTNTEIEKTLYFGFFSTILPSRAYVYNYDSSAAITTQITEKTIAGVTVDKTEADYDASGNTFNFTYDTTHLDYTVAYKDPANRTKDVTADCTINTDGSCTLTDAGTYTFTFKIKDGCGAVWDSSTNDQSDKKVVITVKYKTVAAPSGTVETDYNGEKQSLSTLPTKPSWYDATVYEDTSIIVMDDEFTDASDNQITAEIVSDAYYWSDYATNPTKVRTFNFNIKKKKLEVTFENVGGRLVAKYDESQLYDRDKVDERKPQLITKYSKNGSLDGATLNVSGLGTWYAIAVVGSEYNYYVDAKQSFTVSKQSVNCPTLSAGYDASAQYCGDNQSFVFDGFDISVMGFIAPEGSVSFDGTTLTVKDIKKYEIIYTLKNTELYEWSDTTVSDKKISVEVIKKELEVEFEDSNGLLVAKFKDETQIYPDDKNAAGKPKFTLVTRYSKNGDAGKATYTRPDSAGDWYAHAFIEEECNYSVSGTGEKFNLNKIKLAYPSAADAAALTPTFNGSEHEILLVDYVASAMTYAVPDGAQLEYDSINGELTVKVKNAGEYSVNFTITKPALYEWISEAPVKITVSPKKVQINADEGNPTSWEKDGKTKDLTFTVPTSLCDGDTNLNLVAVCTKNGAEQKPAPAVIYADGKYTLTVPAYSRGKYSLVVKVADGENYSGASQPFEFEITGVGIDVGYNDIVWKIDGKNYTVADEEDEAEIEYSGNNFTLTVDFSASEYAAELKTVGEIGGDWASAVDVGSYTATVRLASTNPELIFDKEFTLKIKIVPKKLTFDDAMWQWQYEGDSEWKELADKSMPSYDGKAVAVRLSPEYLSSLGLKEGDYTLNYINNNDMTEKGDKTTSVEITVTNSNFAAGTDGYVKLTKNWKITAKALSYSWTATQTVHAETAGGEKDFEFPAIEFADGGDYSAHFEYYFKVDGDDTEYTKEEIENYISEHYSETTAVTGSVYVRPTGDDSEVVIAEGTRSFTTGTPKTGLEVTVGKDSGEYGKVDFSFAVMRGSADEKAKTVVTISGPDIEGEKTFEGNSEELTQFINSLNAGSYNVKLSVNEANAESYTLKGKTDFTLEIAKRKVALPTLKDGVTYSGETIYFKDCIEGFDEETMKIIGADDNGIDFGKEWREGGYYTKIAVKDNKNFEFADADGAAEYEYNWVINKFRITDDMWKKDGKDGAVLALPDWVKSLLSDSEVLNVSYSYFNDEHSDALDEVTFKEGASYFVSAVLSGSAAANFEFESGEVKDGRPVSARTVYTVPEEGGINKFFGSVGRFVKDNTAIVIGVGVGLLLLLVLIILLAVHHRRKAYAGYDGYDDEYDYDEEDEADEDDEYDDEDDEDYDDGYDEEEDEADEADEDDGDADDAGEED